MSGNASFRHTNAAILSVCGVEAPIVVTSSSFDEHLAPTYDRLGLKPGLLVRLAGVQERRWWPEDVSFVDAAAMAGAKALAEAGIDPSQVGLVINTSVCREHLEPSAAVQVHHQLGLPTSCLNFDLSNACVGFVNALQVASTMIDAGQVEYALIVDGEGVRHTQQKTLERLASPTATKADWRNQFATLTLGSGAAAMVLGRADRHPEGHRVVGGVSRAGTEHHELCVGTLDDMRTDSGKLFEHGIALALAAWRDSVDDFGWTELDWFIVHQTSLSHIRALGAALDVDPGRFPVVLASHGNLASAAVPFTLSRQVDELHAGDRVFMLGIGSGLNTSFLEITW